MFSSIQVGPRDSEEIHPGEGTVHMIMGGAKSMNHCILAVYCVIVLRLVYFMGPRAGVEIKADNGGTGCLLYCCGNVARNTINLGPKYIRSAKIKHSRK